MPELPVLHERLDRQLRRRHQLRRPALALSLFALTTIVLAAACGGDDRVNGADVAIAPRIHPAPITTDRGTFCQDLSTETRVCWDDACPSGVCVGRPVFPDLPSERGYRCFGAGEERRCIERRLESGPFVCGQDGVCRQRHPRVPDDGEWECMDLDGVVVCHGGGPASGVAMVDPPGPFVCGTRRGTEERVCVDFFPELPLEPATRGFRCLFEHDNGLQRHCADRGGQKRFGIECDAADDCPTAGLCVQQRCVPRRPAPACWYDEDCGDGVCRQGSCIAQGT